MAITPRASRRSVLPEVTPRPELGRGGEETFQAIEAGFSAVNEFIRPAVVTERVAAGEREAIEAINTGTFEPVAPFSVRDEAFNATADTIITTRTMAELDTRMQGAVREANGNSTRLSNLLGKIRSDISANLPRGLDGLATDFENAFTRGSEAATRQTTRIGEARVVARARASANEALEAATSEIETIAIQGGDPAALTGTLADVQGRIAKYGPRGEFTINGVEYPADPSRLGIISAVKIADKMDGLEQRAMGMFLESSFLQSDAPGQFAADFQARVLSGESPLSAGASLETLRSFNSRAYTAESRRKAAADAAAVVVRRNANAARDRVTRRVTWNNAQARRQVQDTAAARDAADASVTTTINSFQEINDAGVPTMVPAEAINEMMDALAPFPDLQRQARDDIAVVNMLADVADLPTPELRQFVGQQQAIIAELAGDGKLDLARARVVVALQDQLAKVRDGITAEQTGFPMINQRLMEGYLSDGVDWDQMRTTADGDVDLTAEIDSAEALQSEAEAMEGMTRDQRDATLVSIEKALANLAGQGKGLGTEAVALSDRLEALQSWSDNVARAAETDVMAFAQIAGVPMAEFPEDASLADVGQIIAQRTQAISPSALAEGVENPVPLSQPEIEAIAESYKASTVAEQVSFLGSVSELGRDQAQAVFGSLDKTSPALYQAGVIYSDGNPQAAAIILQGGTDVKMTGSTPLNVSAARVAVLQDLLTDRIITSDSVKTLDQVALNYARGAALAEGTLEVTVSALSEGYQIALGRQPDGTGGLHQVRAFPDTIPVILPAGWDRDRFDDLIGRRTTGVTIGDLEWSSGGSLTVGGKPMTKAQLLNTVATVKNRSGGDTRVLIPYDEAGRSFSTGVSVLKFDLDALAFTLSGEETPEGRPVWITEGGQRFAERTRTLEIGDKWFNVPTVLLGGNTMTIKEAEAFYGDMEKPMDAITDRPLTGYISEENAGRAAAKRAIALGYE